MAKTPITWEEIALHDKTDNCWIVINDKVYDPTNFLINHPGGPQAILNLAGKDATNEFKKVGNNHYLIKLQVMARLLQQKWRSITKENLIFTLNLSHFKKKVEDQQNGLKLYRSL